MPCGVVCESTPGSTIPVPLGRSTRRMSVRVQLAGLKTTSDRSSVRTWAAKARLPWSKMALDCRSASRANWALIFHWALVNSLSGLLIEQYSAPGVLIVEDAVSPCLVDLLRPDMFWPYRCDRPGPHGLAAAEPLRGVAADGRFPGRRGGPSSQYVPALPRNTGNLSP